METSTGWVKLHRQFLEWEWFDEPNTCRLFIYCLLKANHQDKNYRGETIKRGTFVTSLEVLSNDTKISVRSVRTALKRLESTGEVTSERTTKGTVIQIVKYNDYQVATSETTNERQASDKQVTTTKNEKKEKNTYIPTFDEFKNHALSKKSNIDLEHLRMKYDAWIENGWKNGHGNKIKNWKGSLNNTIPYIKTLASSAHIQQPKSLKDLYE